MYLEFIFIDLLLIHILFQLFYDFVDISPLNNINGINLIRTFKEKLFLSLLHALPSIMTLVLSLIYFGEVKPLGVGIFFLFYFATSLILIFLNWYVPYLWGTSETKKEIIETEFKDTYQILPQHRGNPRPNALHVILHSLFLVNFFIMIRVGFIS